MAATATAGLLVPAGLLINALQDPMKVFDGPGLPSSERSGILTDLDDVHHLRTEYGWDIYAARADGDAVCLVVAQDRGNVGNQGCASKAEFLEKGVTAVLELSAISHTSYGDDLVPTFFHWNERGDITVSRIAPPGW